jgi:hypothetical protein
MLYDVILLLGRSPTHVAGFIVAVVREAVNVATATVSV